MNKPRAAARCPVRYLIGTVLIAIGLLSVRAQQAATEPAAAPAKTESAKAAASVGEPEEVVYLSPFAVTGAKDTGYAANNSMAGTKMNTEVKDLPFSVDVITQEFIHDIGANSVLEALGYAGGVNVTQNNEWDPLISVRGMPADMLRATPCGIRSSAPPHCSSTTLTR